MAHDSIELNCDFTCQVAQLSILPEDFLSLGAMTLLCFLLIQSIHAPTLHYKFGKNMENLLFLEVLGVFYIFLFFSFLGPVFTVSQTTWFFFIILTLLPRLCTYDGAVQCILPKMA